MFTVEVGMVSLNLTCIRINFNPNMLDFKAWPDCPKFFDADNAAHRQHWVSFNKLFKSIFLNLDYFFMIEHEIWSIFSEMVDLKMIFTRTFKSHWKVCQGGNWWSKVWEAKWILSQISWISHSSFYVWESPPNIKQWAEKNLNSSNLSGIEQNIFFPISRWWKTITGMAS